MYAAVAAAFSEDGSSQFGITLLRLLITYKAAAKVELNHDEPGSTFILVPDVHGEVKPKLFADCGVEDLRKALGHLRSGSFDTTIPAEDVALVDQYREAVTGAFAKGRPVSVQVRSHQGMAVVDFKGIPVPQADKLTGALMDRPYSVREEPEVEASAQVT